MHISMAFWFGLMTGTNLYLCLWLFISMSRLLRIEIGEISLASGFFPGQAYTTMLKGTKLVVDYLPITVGVRYLGMLPEDYEGMNEGDKRFALLHQPKFLQLLISAIPIIVIFACTCIAIYLFDSSGRLTENSATIPAYLSQIFWYGLWLSPDKSSIHLAALGNSSLLALLYVFYGIMCVVFLAFVKIMSLEWVEKNRVLQIIINTIFFVSFLFFWFRMPWCFASLLSVSWLGILGGIFQYLIAISLLSTLNVLLLHLFFRNTSGLIYRSAN